MDNSLMHSTNILSIFLLSLMLGAESKLDGRHIHVSSQVTEYDKGISELVDSWGSFLVEMTARLTLAGLVGIFRAEKPGRK